MEDFINESGKELIVRAVNYATDGSYTRDEFEQLFETVYNAGKREGVKIGERTQKRTDDLIASAKEKKRDRFRERMIDEINSYLNTKPE